MSKWYVGPNTVDFMFEAGLHMVFNEKADAARIRDHLREVAEIVTEVVKVGNPVL
jgi:malonyl CoA-acyl carrier protein transacylase